jgi:flagellar biogenesis protein FliO
MLVTNMMMLFLILVVLIAAILLKTWLTRRAYERKQRGFEVVVGERR